jgi:cysteine desulfurase / selenocysteine lyase
MIPALSPDFGPFQGRTWLNAAHQGPLPRAARRAIQAATRMKVRPARLPDDAFWEVPRRLREALAKLIGASSESIALTNSTTYGINVVAQGFDFRHSGDEVLLVDGDFPATVLPWLARRDITVRFLRGTRGRIDPDLLEANLTPRTRVFCTSWVFSFYGSALDLAALAEVCRRREVLFVVNGSQGVGTRDISVESGIDVLSACGFKWLCGPYATGFCWLSEAALERIDYPLPNWLRNQEAGGLSQEMDYHLPHDRGASAYDVFCTANFLNFMPWTAAIEELLSLGIAAVARHNQRLVDLLITGLPPGFQLLSPAAEPERSTLAFISHKDPDRNPRVMEMLARARLDVALREGNIRVSPHLYNSSYDIEALLQVLASAA